MKTLIAGSRTIYNPKTLTRAIRNHWKYPITEIISGMAQGVDMLGYMYGKAKNIPVIQFPADWRKGKSAGYARNVIMVKRAESALILWDGRSKGTQHSINLCREKGIPLLVLTYYYD
jgi:YspA, cpYpsA-related SLOG family